MSRTDATMLDAVAGIISVGNSVVETEGTYI